MTRRRATGDRRQHRLLALLMLESLHGVQEGLRSERKRDVMKIKALLFAGLLVAGMSIGLVACGQANKASVSASNSGSSATQGSSSSEAIRIGVPDDGTNLSRGIKLLEAAGLITVDPSAGIYIEMVQFDAYDEPNRALNAGEIDLNAFQHKAYLASDAAANGYDLTAIGDTLIAPLTMYSTRFDSLDALKEAAGEKAR